MRLLVLFALSATLINECMWQQRKVNQSFDDEAIEYSILETRHPDGTRLR